MQHEDNKVLTEIWRSSLDGRLLPDISAFDTADIDRFRGDLIVIERRDDDYFFRSIGPRVQKALVVNPDEVSALDVYAEGMRELVSNLYEVVMECPSLMVRLSRFNYGSHRRRVEMLYLPVSDGDNILVYILCSTFYKEGHGFKLRDSAADFEHILALDFMPLGEQSPLELLRDSSWLTLNYMDVMVLRDGKQFVGYSGKAISGSAARVIRTASRPQLALVSNSGAFDSLLNAPDFGYDLVQLENLRSLETMLHEAEIDVAALDSDCFAEGENIRMMEALISISRHTGFLVRGEYAEDLSDDYKNVEVLDISDSGPVIGPTIEKLTRLKTSRRKRNFLIQT